MTLGYALDVISSFPLFGSIFRTKTVYEDKSVQNKRIRGKALIVSNHFKLFDYVSIAYVFWPRMVRCVVAEVMYGKNIFLDGLLKSLQTIRVDRTTHDHTFQQQVIDVLNNDGVVLIQPEGKISDGNNHDILPFSKGFVHIALKSGSPIIPVYVNGELFSFKRALVVIGKPISVTDYWKAELSESDNISRIRDIVRNKIVELGEKYGNSR